MTVNELYGIIMAMSQKINDLQESIERLYKEVHTLKAVVESQLLKGVPRAELVHLDWNQLKVGESNE